LIIFGANLRLCKQQLSEIFFVIFRTNVAITIWDSLWFALQQSFLKETSILKLLSGFK
jgi:hypothetical protein